MEQFLPHILTPVYRITEDDTIRDAGMGVYISSRAVRILMFIAEELKTTAAELLDLLQAKVGTTIFANTYNRIRQGALTIQQERRVARVTKVCWSCLMHTHYLFFEQATTNPEAAAKRKLARNVSKKESRKRKNRAFA